MTSKVLAMVVGLLQQVLLSGTAKQGIHEIHCFLHFGASTCYMIRMNRRLHLQNKKQKYYESSDPEALVAKVRGSFVTLIPFFNHKIRIQIFSHQVALQHQVVDSLIPSYFRGLQIASAIFFSFVSH